MPDPTAIKWSSIADGHTDMLSHCGRYYAVGKQDDYLELTVRDLPITDLAHLAPLDTLRVYDLVEVYDLLGPGVPLLPAGLAEMAENLRHGFGHPDPITMFELVRDS